MGEQQRVMTTVTTPPSSFVYQIDSQNGPQSVYSQKVSMVVWHENHTKIKIAEEIMKREWHIRARCFL